MTKDRERVFIAKHPSVPRLSTNHSNEQLRSTPILVDRSLDAGNPYRVFENLSTNQLNVIPSIAFCCSNYKTYHKQMANN